MSIQAVLFDMDGVLVDSEAIMARSGVECLAEYGVSAVPEDFLPFVGGGEDVYIGGVARKYGLTYSFDMKERAYAIYGSHVSAPGVNIVLGTAADVVPHLKDLGYKLAVCSSADMTKLVYNIAAVSRGVGNYFDTIVSGSDVVNKKPAPDVFLIAADRLGIPPEQCTVVEDSINGIEAAVAAGMCAVALTTSFPKSDLAAAGANYIIDSLDDLAEVLIRA